MANYEPAVVCVKYLLFAFNLLLFVFGGALVGCAIWIRSDDGLWEWVDNLDLEHYYVSTYLAITAGCLLMLIAFIGCLGTAIESPCLLIMYFIIMGICVILQIGATVLVWRVAGGDRLQNVLADQINWHLERRTQNDKSRRFLDLIQLRLQCCGAYTFLDYKNMGQDVPLSCNSERTNNIQIRSCAEMLRRFLEVRGGVLGGVSVSLMLLEILAVIFNLCLFMAMRDDEKMRL